jgi:hypothetical protein
MRLALLPLLWLSSSAFAGDLSVGVGAGVAMDLGDAVSHSYNTPTDFGPGPALFVPVRYSLSDRAFFRATLRADAGWGNDRVTWAQTVDGTDYRYYSDTHWSMLLGTALTIGADAKLSGGEIAPYLGAELGPARVTTYHSFGPETGTSALLDPEQNELDNSNNVDPFTAQMTLLTDLHLGVMKQGDSGPGFWGELGYHLAYLKEAPLRKTPAAIDATREAYDWNAIRLAAGVSFPL